MDKKIVDSKIINDYEVLTDDGWVDVNAIHKTIKYEKFILETVNNKLECADIHIVFLKNGKEIFVKNINVGDEIITKNGVEEVTKLYNTGEKYHMYDLELSDNNFKYYTNNILSHNTFYIRHLLSKISKKNSKDILYFPPSMVSTITDPSFVNFINNWVTSNEKDCIILIEDADSLLESRENDIGNNGITNLLNLTDGILNDIFGVQIIATFNTHINKLDKALLRTERLIARKEFIPLDKERALSLSNEIGFKDDDKKKIKDNMTLSDIYSIKKNNEILTHDIKDKDTPIGFR